MPHIPTSPPGGADITSWQRVLVWADGVGGGGAPEFQALPSPFSTWGCFSAAPCGAGTALA